MFKDLVQWSKENYADLPWREVRTLYSTLVSEIMLQQTTVSTVKNHFKNFIEKYPDLSSLARIDEQQMLKEWKGLGYYRRARNLLYAAQELMLKYKGEIPLDYDKLIEIRGVGAYTANAILAIGADQPALALDANLERVLSRLYALNSPKGIKLQREIQQKFLRHEIAKEIEQLGGRAFNEALMDLGRNFCTARKAFCDLCPLSSQCLSFQSAQPLKYPRLPIKTQEVIKSELDLLRVIVRKKGEVLAYQKSEREWLAGQYEVPTFSLHCSEEKMKQYPSLNAELFYFLPSFTSAITRYKITNYVLEMSEDEFYTHFKGKFIFHSYQDGNLSTASLKAINL